MFALRAYFRHYHRLAMLLFAAAMCMKALVPAGYMVRSDARVLTVQICTDSLSHQASQQIAIGQADHPADSTSAKADASCPFMVLGHCLLGSIDPLQLALALAFILALGFAPQASASPVRPTHLRPPLRGPPALA